MAKTKKPKKLNRIERTRAVAASVILTPYTASVQLPHTLRIDPETKRAVHSEKYSLSVRAPFIASGIKTKRDGSTPVCSSDEVKDKCLGFRGKKLSRKALKLDKSATPEDFKMACKHAGGRIEPGYMKPIRPDKMDLDFMSKVQAERRGTKAGPTLRLCLRDDEKGYLVPVASPMQVEDIAVEFRKCVKGKKKNMPACALKLARKHTGEQNPPLGEFSQRGLFSHLFSRGR